ncbi:hypothetical protein ASPACDRAFT_44658 [Aspergillus aculeatus ATCC 16872]|uniref:Uncharacterized protein n=1 Tax=Aspergillus aculeatus (strain ATCC 16872 / CBS 172.66 / WB 5094) TaxID=690307 RepID=A0A1L9WS47_ASPA1|nr:uncharacterized protein ASPACDRAFT_44658 [Aspergillus aculeatus ATCC 16872]OJJ99030.1 hypothetical protein ASPACDRAFT_44658 [Aspergillus aculeatus ATCC 16872]
MVPKNILVTLAICLLGASAAPVPSEGAPEAKRDDADAAYLIGYPAKRDDADAAYLIGYPAKRDDADAAYLIGYTQPKLREMTLMQRI